MNHAILQNSPRLKRVADFLKDGRPHSTLEIIKRAKVCAVSALVSELRANGLQIDCQRKLDRWFYQLRS